MIQLTEQQQEDKKNFLSSFNDSWYFEKLKKFNHEGYTKTLKTFVPRDTFDLYDKEIYYYLDFIFQKNPEIIYDIGCGNNFFKKLFEEKVKIIGINPDFNGFTNENADLKISFEDFTKIYINKIKFAFAINSLHFINPLLFKKRLLHFISIFSTGGRGFITFNIQRLHEKRKLYHCENPNDVAVYIEKILNNLEKELHNKIKFILLENTSSKSNYDDPINGNIRIIFDIINEL